MRKRARVTDDIFMTDSQPTRSPDKPAQKSTSSPNTPAQKSTRIPVNKVNQQASNNRVKYTFYATEATLELLEDERHRRRKAGDRNNSDFSALIREAIERSYGK